MGEEAVLADSGRKGELDARVGRVRNLAFLRILRADRLLCDTFGKLSFRRATIVFATDR